MREIQQAPAIGPLLNDQSLSAVSMAVEVGMADEGDVAGFGRRLGFVPAAWAAVRRDQHGQKAGQGSREGMHHEVHEGHEDLTETIFVCFVLFVVE